MCQPIRQVYEFQEKIPEARARDLLVVSRFT